MNKTMMKMAFCHIGLPCAVLLAGMGISGCSQMQEAVKDATVVTYNGPFGQIRIREYVNSHQIMTDRQSFLPQLTDKSIIGQVKRAVEFDSMLVVCDDRNQVLAFDENSGALVFSIHNVGQGPGEYISLSDIAVCPDGSGLLLLADKKILVYGRDGIFTGREIALDDYYNELATDGDMIYLADYTYSNDIVPETQIVVVDYKSGRMRNLDLKPLQDYAPYCTTAGRSLNVVMDGNDLRAVFTRKFDNNIYSLSGDGCSVFYTVDWGEKAFKLEKDVYECRELTIQALRHYQVYQMVDVQKGDSTVCFSANLPELYEISADSTTVTQFPGIIDSILNVPLSDMFPVTGSRGKVLFTLTHTTMQQYYDVMPDNPPLRERMETMSDDSNPLFIIYTLR